MVLIIIVFESSEVVSTFNRSSSSVKICSTWMPGEFFFKTFEYVGCLVEVACAWVAIGIGFVAV